MWKPLVARCDMMNINNQSEQTNDSDPPKGESITINITGSGNMWWWLVGCCCF